MKILLLGGSGQLGSEINASVKKIENIELLSPSKKELNIEKRDDFDNYLQNFKPNIVINSAAFTDVDGAEENKNLSDNINFKSVENIVLSLKDRDIFFIQISTDYVFGERGNPPYKSEDETSPVTFYGKSKQKAELSILKNLSNFIIIRTASLIGLSGNNFFKTVIKNLVNKNELNIINDQKISVTWSRELANTITNICKDFPKIKESDNKIFHIVNRGYTNRYELSKEIEINYNKLGKERDSISLINPISRKEWKSNAKRPLDSRLLISENIIDNNYNMSFWKDAIRLLIKDYEKYGGLDN